MVKAKAPDELAEGEKIVEGEKDLFEDGVLYKDIDGRKGHCYYARSDQNARLWFSDYKIIAIYDDSQRLRRVNNTEKVISWP